MIVPYVATINSEPVVQRSNYIKKKMKLGSRIFALVLICLAGLAVYVLTRSEPYDRSRLQEKLDRENRGNEPQKLENESKFQSTSASPAKVKDKLHPLQSPTEPDHLANNRRPRPTREYVTDDGVYDYGAKQNDGEVSDSHHNPDDKQDQKDAP